MELFCIGRQHEKLTLRSSFRTFDLDNFAYLGHNFYERYDPFLERMKALPQGLRDKYTHLGKLIRQQIKLGSDIEDLNRIKDQCTP